MQEIEILHNLYQVLCYLYSKKTPLLLNFILYNFFMKTNKNFEDDELQNRIDLAAAYHLADLYGFSDIIWNHITCKTSSKKNTFLINRFGLRYDEVTASNLLEIDLEANIISGDGEINFTGFVIHGAIHQTREDLNCVMHSHSRS